MIAIYTIGIFFLVALFAYPLAPDSSPNANRKIEELREKPPGYRKLFLLQPIQQKGPTKSFISRLFTGERPDYKLLPVNSFFFARDSIIVQHYLGKGKHETLSFPLRSLLPTGMHRKPVGEQQMAVYHHQLDTRTFLLGTDHLGRDILSRLLIGARISIFAGIVAVLISLIIGILLGTIAGFYRGWADKLLMYFVNLLWSIPALLLIFAITLSSGRGMMQVFIAIGLTMWVGTARLIRDQVLRLRKKEYVQTAMTLGAPNLRIIIRHILPAIGRPLMVIAAGNFATAVLIEAGLSFLGIGQQPPIPGWGLMIREHDRFLISGRPLLTLIPGLAILTLTLACNILSHALRAPADLQGTADQGQAGLVHD